MKAFNNFTIVVLLMFAATLESCKDQACVGCTPPPPAGAVLFRAFYQNQFGADLLDTQIVGSYQAKEIKVISRVEKGGVQSEINLNDKGISIEYDDQKRKNYIGIWIPTPAGYSGTPIATYVTLKPQDLDTITYTFTNAKAQNPFQPEFLYYNKELVWELSKVKPDDNGSITITKK